MVADDAESAAQVRPLLPASPHSVVMVTSRWRLAGLALDGGQFVDVDMLDEASAVELLSRGGGREKVELEPAPARRLVGLCGGLPIALSVAAARLSTRPRWSISRVVGTLADEQRRLSALAIRETSRCGRASTSPTANCPPRSRGCTGCWDCTPGRSSGSASPPRPRTSPRRTPTTWFPTSWTPTW